MTAALGQAALELQVSTQFREQYVCFSDALSSAVSENATIYTPLVNLMNSAICHARNHYTANASPLMFTHDSSILPVAGRHKPDITGIPFNDPTDPSAPLQRPTWDTVSVACEYKSAAPKPPSSPSDASRRYVNEADSQLMRYTLEMRTAQPTRAAGYGIQFTKDHASFWYSDADSTITSQPVPIDSPEFVGAIMRLSRASKAGLGYLLYFVDANEELSTRPIGARLLLGGITYTIATDSIGKQRAIKLSWQVTTRVSEVEMIRLAHKRSVGCMVDVIYSEGTVVRLEDRCLRVPVLPLYMPLYKVQDPNHFLRASISLLDAIHDLYIKGKILHRDVSVNNLMVQIDRPWEGVLLDLDLAHEEKVDSQNPTSPHRTGTLPFMALDLLHVFCDVLVWVAGKYEDGVEVDRDLFNRWCEGDWTSISDNKSAFLSFKMPYSRFAPTPPYQFLSSPILQLRRSLSQAHQHAREINAFQLLQQPLSAGTRPREHGAPWDEGHAGSASGQKRKRLALEADATENVPIYPKDLHGFDHQALRSVLGAAFTELDRDVSAP
ncbi:hypothetical protein FRC10_006252 [Ceratobasidium sp. 414]|nr:hypothetical protein FRC10_006252 [Ceratobasidium sp. 414]